MGACFNIGDNRDAKKMVNVFKKIMLFTALLVALVIFVVGLYTGFLLDDYRISDIDNTLTNKEVELYSFVIEEAFFDTFGSNKCSSLLFTSQKLGNSLWDIGNTLTRYDNKGTSHGDAYNLLKRKYFLLEIKSYTVRKQISDRCLNINGTVILFFYNTKDNQDSLNQGYVLDTMVRKYKDLIVFSIDKDFNETAVQTIVDYYNITSAPTIVLDFNRKFEGYTSEYLIAKNFNK